MESITACERENTYRFLASLYLKPPSDSIIAMIKDGSILSAITANEESNAGSPFYSELAEFVKNTAEMPNLKEELEAEHTALFALPSGILPQEAAYLEREKRLGGRVTISVRQFYERAGMEILDSCIEMPDHIGMELEFMGFLCKLEKEFWDKAAISSLQECIEFQKTFLNEHLSRWVHQCCGKVIVRATYGFYKAIANFTMEFMKGEEEYVSELYAKICKEGKEICETAA
ncbi:MAG: molecular chaperone TorD family protein [Nitrospirota bacterium]|nr:molecular chaperone TorD family protein [Nitrospirota bacterium]